MPAGSLVGSLAVATLGDKIGRKKIVILAGMIWTIGSILQCASIVSCPSNLCGLVSDIQVFRTVVCSLSGVLSLVSP